MELYKSNRGSVSFEKASLYDICEWWIEKYPADIFIINPRPIIEARKCMEKILSTRKFKEGER